MKEYTADIYIKEKFELAESPFYLPKTGILSWVDITRGKAFFLSSSNRREEVAFEEEIGAMVPASDGGYVVAGTKGLYRCTVDKRERLRDLSSLFPSCQRCNDAKSDPAGRLFFGSSVRNDHEPSGNLYCYDGSMIRILQRNTRIANGLAWSSDHRKFYFSDSLYHGIFSYDYDRNTGDILNRRLLFSIENGVPDGMCIDSKDHLWVAVWGGKRIEERDAETGDLISVVHVDAANVTSCCFMGSNLDTLFITTSGKDLSGEKEGCLYSCKVETVGLEPDLLRL